MSAALVVDDEDADRLAIADALSRAGISVLLSDGDPNQVPVPAGVRVVVLDLQLVQGSLNEATIVSTAAGVLERLLPSPNGPYVVLLWSTHDDLLPAFKERVGSITQPPIAIATLDKASAKDEDDHYMADEILGRVFGALAEQHAVQLLMGWEDIVDRAASATSAAVVRGGPSSNAMLAHLVAQSLPSPDNSIPGALAPAFVRALSPLLYDEVVHSDLADPRLSDAIVAVSKPPLAKLDSDDVAELNARIHLDAQADSVRPGNIYHLAPVRKRVIGGCPDETSLLAEMKGKGKSLPLERVVPILVEVTPTCDFYQGKLATSRLLGGLLVDPAKADAISSSPAFKVLPAMDFSRFGLDGPLVPALNSHRWVSVQQSVLSREAAICRFRDEIMMDVRSWATGQANRVGILSVK